MLPVFVIICVGIEGEGGDLFDEVIPTSTDLVERRAEVVEKLEEFEAVIDPILTILAKPEVSKHLESSK